jgi:hypothetical protein
VAATSTARTIRIDRINVRPSKMEPRDR